MTKRASYCPQPANCLAKKTGRCVCQYQPNHKDLHPQEYYAWVNMKTRCNNPNYSLYHRYGGRGIKVCDEWCKSFEAFLDHVGEKSNSTDILDRIDNTKGYEPGNVRWVDKFASSRNRDVVQPLTINGTTYLLPDWEAISGTSRKTIWRRLQDGWPAELAVFGDPMPYDLRTKADCINLYWKRYIENGPWQYRMVDT